MRTLLLCTLLALAVVVAGCATSDPINVDYSTATDETVYATRLMKLRPDDINPRETQPPEFQAQVTGDCTGVECQPGRYDMMISVSSPVRVDIGMQDLVIRVDGEKLEWKGPFELRTGRGFAAHMRSFSVPLNPDEVRMLARADDVKLFLGSAPYLLLYDRREPLRVLVNRLDAARKLSESQ